MSVTRQLVRLGRARYRTLDDEYEIEQGWGSWHCEQGHSMGRYGGWCGGDRDHPDKRGWYVFKVHVERPNDEHPEITHDLLERVSSLRDALLFISDHRAEKLDVS